MSPAIIFSAINLTKAIGEYLGFIEGSNTMLQKLVHQSFQSAKLNLEYAYNTNETKQIEYLKVARSEFIRAVSVEENEAKISALLGLAMCQHWLNDQSNSNLTFLKIKDVQLTKSEKTKYAAVDAFAHSSAIVGIGAGALIASTLHKKYNIPMSLATLMVATGSSLAGRQAFFAEFKQKALASK